MSGIEYSNGQYVGSSGHFSVVSFGYTKVLDVGGGGLLLMDDIHAYKKALHLSKEFVCLDPVHRTFLADRFRETYYDIWSKKKLIRNP